ncbi:hypothetical protein AKJ37_02145 [candidate division MSBL1 archaeon SCGC-AAA259I09]|uniref:UspA domain-containing protein n=2 Tax=candidate division MSBL1 TaxID=215777 RepID=A0A133UUK9_9EURY|nr:hypothetical protein AKJ37_02145 [candidate division MSBL1 archaeon SCGC-AAA259I09]KXA99496.1 hypothetical protein AKJ40_02990 [candidate division MSBL1 archaeon SCGC-AAA259M10]
MKKVRKILVPYFGGKLPKKAEEEAFNRLEAGGELYLLHIFDEESTRSFRYMSGQRDESDLLKTAGESIKGLQEKEAEKYVEKVKSRAEKKNFNVSALYTSGDPAEETLKVADERSVQLIVVERLRDSVTSVFLGSEINRLKNDAPCDVITVKPEKGKT